MAGSLQQQRAYAKTQTMALQENETSLRRITDNMYDVITQMGADGTILYASPSHQWVLGMDPAEALGKLIFESLHPDDMAEALTIFSQAVSEGVRPKSFALRYRHANGKYLWMECVSTILRDEQGDFSGAILSSRDISERKRMEAELSASEQRYRMLAENASDVIWSADMNLQMNYVSPAAEKLFGYSVEEVLAQNIMQGMTPESAAYALSFFSQIMMEVETGPREPLRGASRALELEWIRKDGSTVWTEAKVSFLLDEQDKPVGLLGVTRDITERRQVEEARQKALAYEYETRRANELARSNAMILALSSVAVSLENTSNPDLLLKTLGSELQKLNMQCAVAAIDPSGETATLQYVSLPGAAIKKIEKLAGISLKNYYIPKIYWIRERLVNEKIPVWYPIAREVIHHMFPIVPNFLADQAWKLLGIQAEGMICILPLIVNDKVIGGMPVWGPDLHEADSPFLAIFASQVAGILQKAIAHENEIMRANELARSNSMILALSKVAAQLESTSQPVEIFESVGRELKYMGIDSMIGLFDDGKQSMRIQYMSVQQDVIRWVEKITAHNLKELSIPRHFWPTDKVVTEKTAYWDPNLMRGMLKIFPVLTKRMNETALKMAGINVNDPVCYLPLMNEQDVFGVLAVWGAGLMQSDVSAFSILANQITTAIRNNRLFETEAQRTRDLDILLKASEATSSSLDFETVMHTLAAQLLEISGFESCFISEWDKDTDSVIGRLDDSRTFWRDDKRDSYSMSDYPHSNQVLQTGKPIILQGDFEGEEKQWMDSLKRSAAILLPLYSQEKIIGLVEIEMINKNAFFDPQVVHDCRNILANAASSIIEPLSSNEPKELFEIEAALLQATGGEVCSFSEWDQRQNRLYNLAVSTRISWAAGQGTRFNPDLETWRRALDEGRTISFVRSEDINTKAIVYDGAETMDVESLIIFPLQKGSERIGVIELYDFNHEIHVTTEQITLLKTIADKASYSIENARLLQLTQRKLEEQTGLLNEKEVLLKEIHHRVKNNLQIISSLLNLQTDQVKDSGTLRILHDSQTRVRSMALIHEKLYQSKSMAKIDFGEYVTSLTKDLFRSYQRSLGEIKLNIHVDEVTLDLDYAVPCGLILNELMTNALKYAFPEGRKGSIWVELRADPKQFISLRVADDGVGLPAGLDILKNKSLGLQLVNSLVKQIDGKLEVENSSGTAFCVTFKV
jgi:PAS domain S-box-containing protein